MVVVVRKDLNMSPGKVAAQVAHAPVELINNFHKQGINLAGYPLREWYEEGGRMVVLGVDTEQEIERLEKACVSNKLNFHAYRDGGITEVHPNTLTVLGIGPDLDKNIDKVTEGLEAY
jgi:PTH2 family peptidyl-tRNA hydrolase